MTTTTKPAPYHLLRLIDDLRRPPESMAASDLHELYKRAADVLALRYERAPAIARLIPAIREVLRISDRDHDAWNEAKAALAEFEAQPAAQAFSLAAAMEDAAIRYAGGHTVDFAQEAAAIANGQQQAGAVPANQCAAEGDEVRDAAQALINHLWKTQLAGIPFHLVADLKQALDAQPQPKGTDAEAQEWNYVIECRDGFVPNVKGPFNKQFTESTLREFAAMRPSYLMVVRSTGWPEVQSGVEWIDMCGDKRRGRLAVQAPAPAPEKEAQGGGT